MFQISISWLRTVVLLNNIGNNISRNRRNLIHIFKLDESILNTQDEVFDQDIQKVIKTEGQTVRTLTSFSDANNDFQCLEYPLLC